MQVYSPDVLWHGGAIVEGKTDPVFSVDLHPTNVLCTAGIDENLPPKGCVRLWKVPVGKDMAGVDDNTFKNNFIVGLADHQMAVNVCRFSPCGTMLATASTRQIVVYTVKDPSVWQTLSPEKEDMIKINRTYLRPSLDEIRDLAWSPDCSSLVAGSVDNKGEILRISSRDSILLHGHTSYVQGVAWDPLNHMVATQSADRSVKIHQIKGKPGHAVKLANKGNVVAKMHSGFDIPEGSEAPELTAADFGMAGDGDDDGGEGEGAAEGKRKADKKNLYADSTVPSFFRRPAFSPDGLLLFTPTGVHRNSMSVPPESVVGQATIGASSSGANGNSFATHVYSREHLSSPIISLLGLEDPSVAVRCSPVLYKMVNVAGAGADSALLRGDYRIVFAVITITAVYIYDTQHAYPIARVGGLHHACINDATWGSDGNTLVVCSSDGYVTFVQFAEGVLGVKITPDKVPATVKNLHRVLYDYTPPPVEVVQKKPKAQTAPAPAPAPAPVGGTGATAANPNVLQAKKRIAPTQVTVMSPGAGNAQSLPKSPEEILEKINQEPVHAPAAQQGQSGGDKKRKRIQPTPVVVSNALPMGGEASSSAGNTD